MLTKNNWIKVDWDGKCPRDRVENLRLEFTQKASAIPASWEAACDATALDIASKYDNLYVGMSGGADSEHIADILYRNKIPFTPIIIEWVGFATIAEDQSNVENQYAYYWCKKRNITPIIMRLGRDIFTDGSYETILNKIKPRLQYGATMMYVSQEVERLGGNLVTGMQLEYFPDAQFGKLEKIPAGYKGFVANESDFYFEADNPDRHPWAFYYWSPEMMAATVAYWNTTTTMTETKAELYGTPYRPKLFNGEFIRRLPPEMYCRNKYGTIDCVLLGDKEELLAKLLG